jgi:hypothetical protein
MHLDRLSDELLSGTYGKQEEELPKKKRKKSNVEINSPDDEQKKDV